MVEWQILIIWLLFQWKWFKNIIDETDFDKDGKKYAMKGTWGY